MKIEKYIPLFFLAGVLTVSAFGYYAGGTANHGHTATAGDGGPLSNPVISGTATVTGVSASTLNVTGLATISKQVVVQSTITTLTVTNFNAPTSSATNFTSTNLTVVNTSSAAHFSAAALANPALNQINPQYSIATASGNTGFYVSEAGGIPTVGFSQGGFASFRCQEQECDFAKTVAVATITTYGGAGVNILGTTNGTSAGTGNYAEEVSSAVAGNKAWTLATGNYMDVATMTVTAGDWLLYGCVCFTGATTGTAYVGDIGTTGGNSAAGQLGGDNMNQTPLSPTAAADVCLPIPLPQHVIVSAPTAYYLKASATFSGGTPKAYGTIRRVRNPH